MANPKSTASKSFGTPIPDPDEEPTVTRSATDADTASDDAAPDSGQTVAQEGVSAPVRVEFFQTGETAYGYRLCDRLGNIISSVEEAGATQKEALQAAQRDERTEGLVLQDGVSDPVTLNAW